MIFCFRGKLMWRLVVSLYTVLVPVCASAIELSLALESRQVPLYGAACGILTISNPGLAEVEIDVPSMITGALQFEVRRDGNVVSVSDGDELVLGTRRKCILDGGAQIRMPFYLLKNRDYFFDVAGPCELRASFDPCGVNDVVLSTWEPLNVVDDSDAERWKAHCDTRVRIYIPFELPLLKEVLDKFQDTPYVRTYLMYQAFNPAYLVEPLGAAMVDERRNQMEATLKTSGVGREMWDDFSAGKCFHDSNRYSGVQYLLYR